MTRQPRPPVQSPYYTPAQVCDLLQISLSTLKRRLADKTFTRVRVPKTRAVRIPRREVDALLPKTRRGQA